MSLSLIVFFLGLLNEQKKRVRKIRDEIVSKLPYNWAGRYLKCHFRINDLIVSRGAALWYRSFRKERSRLLNRISVFSGGHYMVSGLILRDLIKLLFSTFKLQII